MEASPRSVSIPVTDSPALPEVLAGAVTESGRSLRDLAEEGPVLLVFLRHFGCSYCRQSISDVAEIQAELAAKGVRPVFVHMGTPERARPYFDYYRLSDVERVSDPDAVLYSSAPFALPKKHPLSHFLVPKNWKGWLTGGLQKYGIGMIREDSSQMPGVFVLRDGAIAQVFRFKTIADQPDYLSLVS